MSGSERCMCGDPACASCGPAQGYDLRCQGPAWDKAVEAQIENALDHVVETILLFGEYPQPPSHAGRRLFDLAEWCEANIDAEDRLECYVDYLLEDATGLDGNDRRTRHLKMVEQKLREHLKYSDMVTEKAEEYAADEL